MRKSYKKQVCENKDMVEILASLLRIKKEDSNAYRVLLDVLCPMGTMWVWDEEEEWTGN